jgi:Cu(I)/Ag(I) efflux system periplasmic protein CusF
MNKLYATALAALIGLFPAVAMSAGEHDAHAGHMASQNGAASESPMSEGVIKKVDKATGKVTIAHGPLVNLKMPAMTMVFRVKEVAWIDQMQTDVKIRFVADTINGSLTIVRFELAK